MLRVVTGDPAGAELRSALDEIVLEGAQRMLAAALEAEVDAYIAGLTEQRDGRGRRPVVRNGHAEPRILTTAAGPIEVHAPRVNDRRIDERSGERCRFRSSILAPWCRKSAKVAEVLPLMYLHGMSSLDFAPALSGFFGSAAGLSASVVTRLTRQWQDEARAFAERRLEGRDYVYVWADGVHFNLRLEEDRLCALVIVGVGVDGTKELVPITDGYRESTESWADLLRDLKRGDDRTRAGRGRRGPRVLGRPAGDLPHHQGSALLGTQGRQRVERPAEVGPAQRPAHAGRDPRRRGPRPCVASDRRLRSAVRGQVAPGRGQGRRRRRGAPRLPAEHWIHLKTTNPIESTFATVRLRTRVTEGPGSRAAGLAMAFKLIESAQDRWRAVNGPHLVALVRAGARFDKGVIVEANSRIRKPSRDQRRKPIHRS